MYFVTAMNSLIKEEHMEGNQPLPYHRCLGWFESFHEAKVSVENNLFSIYQEENETQKYLLIEFIPSGNFPLARQISWFSFNSSEEVWVEVEKPKNAAQKYNFALGN